MEKIVIQDKTLNVPMIFSDGVCLPLPPEGKETKLESVVLDSMPEANYRVTVWKQPDQKSKAAVEKPKASPEKTPPVIKKTEEKTNVVPRAMIPLDDDLLFDTRHEKRRR